MSVGPSKAAIVFDVVMPCPLGFARSVGRVLLEADVRIEAKQIFTTGTDLLPDREKLL